MLSHRDDFMMWPERLYNALLWLYPERHRQMYGSLMSQLFLDQLRDARLEGRWSILSLWLRTVVDVLRSAPDEHLKEVNIDPNKPLLSWRGAMLMIIPALLLLSGWLPVSGMVETALYIVVVPIALVIMAAALVAWRRTRRIPIWGMPVLGMVMTILVWYSVHLPMMLLPITVISSSSGDFQTLEQSLLSFPVILTYALQWMIIVGLLVLYARQHSISWMAWGTLGVYIFMSISVSIKSFFASSFAMSSGLPLMLLNVFYIFSLLFLLLLPVALGLLFAHRQGVEALPFVLSGIPFIHQFTDVDSVTFLYSKMPVAALYNTLWQVWVFVIAPLWMVRAHSSRGRLLGIMIPILMAVAIQMFAGNVGASLVSSSVLLWKFAGTFVQPILAVGVAYMFYRHGGDKQTSTMSETPNWTMEMGM